MRVPYDQAAFRLAEDLRQPYRRYCPALQDISQYVAGAYGRQLVRIANHDKARAMSQCAEKCTHEKNVDHAHLINDQTCAIQRIIFIAHKRTVFPAVFQQAMQCFRFTACCFAHAFGGASGRCCKQYTFFFQH